MSANVRNKRKSFSKQGSSGNDSDLAPRTRNKTEGGRKYVEKSTSEWSNKHKNHIPHTNRCAHKNDTGSGIIRVTGPPSNRTPHRFSGRYHGNQSAAYSSQRTRTSPFQAAKNADISLSESFKESCSIWDKGVTYNGGFRNDCETARQSGENYSDYEDWDSDNSSDLIQRCFELSQSPPDPERPDIHSVLQSLMHVNSDDTYEQFKQDLHGSRAQSYYYFSGASTGPKTFREHFDEEGSRNVEKKNKKMRVSPYNVEGDEDVNWKRNDRRIVVNKEDDAPRKAVKSAVYSPSKGLNQLVSYNSSGDSSEDEGSSRPAVGVRSVVFKRDAEDAEMPSLEDDEEVTSKPKSPKKKKGKSEKEERYQHLKKQFTDKKEKEKKEKATYVPPHRRDQGTRDEHSSSENSYSAEEGKSTTRQLEIDSLRKKVDRIDELVRLKKEIVEAESTIMQKDSEIEKLRNKVRPDSEEIVKDDSEMLRQRVKSKSGSSAAAKEESKILRIREKSRSKPETNTSSDSEMLRQRTKAQNPSGAEAITTDEEVLRLRRDKSSSSLGKAEVVASSDSDILRIRRNVSASSLENLDDTDSPRPKTKSGSSKSWADVMDQEESQNKKRPASARTSRTKPRGKGVSAVYRSSRWSRNIPELEDDDDDSGSTASGSRSEPRKHKFKFGADESSPSVKQRLSLGGTSSTSKTKRNEWNSGKQNSDGGKTKSRYDMFKEESRKTVTGNFQDAANEMRMEMGGAKSWAKKRTENNIWGKQTSSKGAAAEKDHTDKSLSYQERLDALRSKCSHMYQKPGTSPYDISWKTGNWKAKFQKMYQNLPKIPYIDTHCHIDFLFQRTNFRGTFNEYLDENSETVPETFAGCVAVFCNPSTYFSEKKLFFDLLKEPNVHAAVGVHPKSAGDYNARIETQMKRMLDHEKVVALGEIGLDYSGTFYQEAATQKRVFIRQLQLAEELELPIVIHCRDAEEDCVEIMEQTIDRHHVIHRHCWTGSWEECEIWLDKFPNSFIGLTPLVTHTSGRALPVREVAARLPLDKLLLETDAPYFIPSCIPKESMKFTHPALAITVASEVAELQDVPVGVVLKHVAQNTYKMYGIKPELD